MYYISYIILISQENAKLSLCIAKSKYEELDNAQNGILLTYEYSTWSLMPFKLKSLYDIIHYEIKQK